MPHDESVHYFISPTITVIYPLCLHNLNLPFSLFKQNLKVTFLRMFRFIVDDTSRHCKMTLGKMLVMNAGPICFFVFLGRLLHGWFHKTWSPVYRLITLAQIMPQPAPWETQASACPTAWGLSRLDECGLPGTDIK